MKAPTVGEAEGLPEFTGQARGKQALWKGGWTFLDSKALVLLYPISLLLQPEPLGRSTEQRDA